MRRTDGAPWALAGLWSHWTDPHTGEPALSHCRAALSHGKHVITTNQGPIALAQQSLTQLAAANGAAIKYEGAVMSGTPVLRSQASMNPSSSSSTRAKPPRQASCSL